MYDVKHGKLKRRQPAVAEIKSFRADELAEMGCICAWDGCTATHDGSEPSPGWRILYLAKAYDGDLLPSGEPAVKLFSRKTGLVRDTQLCPEHARLLDEELLKPMMRELHGKTQGAA